MITLKKDGIVRIVATEAEAERWEGLGYKREATAAKFDPLNTENDLDVNKITDEIASMTVEQLREYAQAHAIDIGNATSQNGILKKIQDAKPIASSGE